VPLPAAGPGGGTGRVTDEAGGGGTGRFTLVTGAGDAAGGAVRAGGGSAAAARGGGGGTVGRGGGAAIGGGADAPIGWAIGWLWDATAGAGDGRGAGNGGGSGIVRGGGTTGVFIAGVGAPHADTFAGVRGLAPPGPGDAADVDAAAVALLGAAPTKSSSITPDAPIAITPPQTEQRARTPA
jgi:hypothetical protein